MRYAGVVIKAVSLILIVVLFGLFLYYAVSFGEKGNVADLNKSNIMAAALLLILISSVISSIMFDFYEKNKQHDEQVFSKLNKKIDSLSELERKITETTAEYTKKMESLHDDLANKVEENTAKFENCMTQFANLSVQVFAKDKQAQNMQHGEITEQPTEFSGDYFNHYTEKVPEDILVQEEPEVLSAKDKVEISDEPEVLSAKDKVVVQLPETPAESDIETKEDISVSEDLELPENTVPENLINDILSGQPIKKNEAMHDAEEKLSAIFNDELADTLSGLEIMKDDDNSEPEEIDLSSYFSETGKIKL